jgi:hypothetical protein
MFASLRKTLIDSHIAAITVAWMLFISLDGISCAAERVVYRLILIIQIYQSHQVFNVLGVAEDQDRMMLSTMLSCLIGALAAIFFAWLVSHWIYGVGPLRILALYRDRIARKSHA